MQNVQGMKDEPQDEPIQPVKRLSKGANEEMVIIPGMADSASIGIISTCASEARVRIGVILVVRRSGLFKQRDYSVDADLSRGVKCNKLDLALNLRQLHNFSLSRVDGIICREKEDFSVCFLGYDLPVFVLNRQI